MYRRKLDWDDARVFLAVVREGSLRAAGRALGLSQPTVGRRLAGFEATIGGERLFDRLPEGLRLTAAGTAIIPLAEGLETAALALQRRHAATPESGGTVRISVGEWAGEFLALCLADSRRRPGLPERTTIELVESDETANLSRREADLAVRHGCPQTGELYVSRVGIIACAAYRSAAPAALSESWITYTEEQAHYAVSQWTARRITATGGGIAVRASGLAMQLAAARAGAGLVVLPCYLGDGDPALTRATHRLAELDAAHWLIVHRDLRRVPRVRAVMAWVKDIFAAQRPRLEGLAAV